MKRDLLTLGWLIAGTLCLVGGVRAAPKPITHDFSLQQLLSAPFPSDLIAAPTGGRLAWVFNTEGARNVWLAEPAEPAGQGGYRSRALTAYTGDDGVDLGELSWSPSGRQVFFTRGGSLEGGGPVNTMSLATGAPAQTVWSVSTEGGAAREIGAGHSPAASPRGDLVAYISDGQIWTAPASGGTPSQLVHDRGQSASLTWSPDGGRLAFVSNRRDHSLIGVYDVATRSIAWMAPSVDTDLAPEWSPDGRRLAFVRTPAGAGGPFLDRREGQPWSIWVGDPASGDARAVWTAPSGRGSVFHALETERVLMWGAGDTLVFPWERSGWAHLYALALVGGEPRELTPGAGELFNAVLSADRKRLVYSSNIKDTDHRHLWEVSLLGSAPQPLTSGAGIEDDPALASDGRVAALHATAKEPLRPVALQGGASVDLARDAMPTSFPTAWLVEPEPVVFSAADGLSVHGQLFLPPPGRRHRGPAILFFHGGPERQMLLGWHPMDAYSFMYGMNQYLANQGYVVLSVNYRGGTGYGLDFREPLRFGPRGASELDDILGAARYLRSRADVDPTRIGLWGGSYGGLMTALGLARAPDLFAAGVDYAGVHDWRPLLPQLNDPAAPKGASELAFQSSPLATVDRWRAPVLLVHADDDRNVPFAQTVELVQALRPRGVEVEQVVLPDEIHDLLRHRSWLTFFGAADDFLARRLAPRAGTAASK